MNRRQRASFKYMVLGAVAALAGSSLSAAELKLGNAGELEIKGDIRLRQESKTETFPSTKDNRTSNRQRYRLRIGMNYKLDSKLSVKTQLASGTGEQTSTNQSLGNNSAQKQVWVDLAYVDFKPLEGVGLYGGRMKNPLWQAYASDIVWDTDYNPEGIAETFKLRLGNSRVFFNALQSVINEDVAGSAPLNRPQYLFSNQVGMTLPLPFDSRITLAGAIHDFVNESSKTFTTSPGKAQGTNTFPNDIRVNEVTGEIFTNLPVIDVPLSIQGSFIKNTASRESIKPNDNTGFQAGGIVGKADKKRGFEAAFFRKSVGKDATEDDINDSDFPGTNRVGNIYWLAYGVSDVTQLKAKYFDTRKIDGTKHDIQLLQVDLQVKF
ncbi:MAG: putative porin [Elusimicrobia bacterium]|nr:putative porin [Elusimicrobiota bacterium]MBP9128091.1 putative porin [Elusimicrobiota bacterium]MBP9698635.1 putative porin [Elusimicrobiota bacterium]